MEKTFDDWFHELEGYSLRSERFYNDVMFHDPKRLTEWLKAAYNQGRLDQKENQ